MKNLKPLYMYSRGVLKRMLSDLEKQFIVGGYLLGDPNFVNSVLAKNIASTMDVSEYTACINLYYQDNLNASHYINLLNIAESTNMDVVYKASDAATRFMCGMATPQDAADIQNLASVDLYKKTYEAIDIPSLLTKTYNVKRYITKSILDELVGVSGFENQRLYVFAGYEKSGKSLTLLNLAKELAFNNVAKILYLSLENSEYDTQQRLQKMTPYTQGDLKILCLDKAGCSDIQEISKDYDIVVIDYLTRIRPSKDQMEKSKYDLLGDYCDFLHQLAIKENKLIITAAQLTRDAKAQCLSDKNSWAEGFLGIDTSFIADSINISRNADVVIAAIKHTGVDLLDRQYFHNIASRVDYNIEAAKFEFSTKYPLSYLWKSGRAI